ncbi:hypothetical protein [Halovenus marina]|uniref:hypothetical protein n=1 Tax=Halovenus marina TaxID=3396621 RepID=UPI003F563C74
MNEGVLKSKRNRSLLGLVGAIPVAIVGVVLFDGPMLWLLLGVAALDAVLFPYLLGRAVDE